MRLNNCLGSHSFLMIEIRSRSPDGAVLFESEKMNLSIYGDDLCIERNETKDHYDFKVWFKNSSTDVSFCLYNMIPTSFILTS